VPITTGWMGENHWEALPTAVYGAVLLMSGLAFLILERTIIHHQGAHSKLKAAVGKDVKGMLSAALYIIAIPLAFVHQVISDVIYVAVALMWLIPDRRIESSLGR
jgi:uncharacterized membrane protein